MLSTPSAPAHAAPPAKNTASKNGAAHADGRADYESAHFLLHTDLPAKEAKELLARLETMISLISKYWGRPPVGVIECFVVKDLGKWPAGSLDPQGRYKIEQQAGVTLTDVLSMGGKKVTAKSVVYAVADHGTPQHEAVHAYCGQSFGTCGPLWYSEGMAEMGQYWRTGDSSVHCHPTVLKYIQQSSPKKTLNEIVNAKREATGDSWQNYAWRWALCHLLANNPNYRDRFRPLGLGFLTEQKVSFEDTYGAMRDEISFEYKFFLEHIDDGFRVDLCSWDWKRKFKPLAGSTSITAKVKADHGWQATSVSVREGDKIEFAADGKWRTSKEAAEITADGDKDSEGRLVGVLMQDFKLGEPFELGQHGEFTAPADGKLYVRCQDKWGELADNQGTVTVKLKLATAGNPPPKAKSR